MPPTPPHPIWGAGVRTLREEQGLTQTQLAELSGVGQPTISRVERGSRQISDGVRVRLATALGVDAHGLFPYLEEAAAS